MNQAPDYMEIVVQRGGAATAAQVAQDNVLALDTAMIGIYDEGLAAYKKHFRERVPVIFGLFTAEGGQYILWRPGQPAEVAPSAPVLYQLCKSVGHAALAVYSCVAPYLENPADNRWRAPLEVFKTRLQIARRTAGDLDIPADSRERVEKMLDANISAADKFLSTADISVASLKAFAASLTEWSEQNIREAGKIQVEHWTGVLQGWKSSLGADWERTYAVANTLYVTRRNNIHYTILANAMGREAMNVRLLLLEGSFFEAPTDQLFDVLVRIVADRAVGEIFFNYGLVMDSELIWDGAREALVETGTAESPALLPEVSPLLSHEWPWNTGPGEGPTGLESLGLYNARAKCPMGKS